MFSEERLKLIAFLAQNGIEAKTFPDAELRQQAQKIISSQKLKSKAKKENKLATKKIPG
jgi:hypothetical protein